MNEPICIQIKTSCANGEMSIAVLDTGIGIPEEIIPIIGKTPVSYRKEGGSGRGLYFVHRFLQNVDGLLKISNIKSGLKKGGTQVVITIPILH